MEARDLRDAQFEARSGAEVLQIVGDRVARGRARFGGAVKLHPGRDTIALETQQGVITRAEQPHAVVDVVGDRHSEREAHRAHAAEDHFGIIPALRSDILTLSAQADERIRVILAIVARRSPAQNHLDPLGEGHITGIEVRGVAVFAQILGRGILVAGTPLGEAGRGDRRIVGHIEGQAAVVAAPGLEALGKGGQVGERTLVGDPAVSHIVFTLGGFANTAIEVGRHALAVVAEVRFGEVLRRGIPSVEVLPEGAAEAHLHIVATGGLLGEGHLHHQMGVGQDAQGHR